MESGKNERVTIREFCANGSCMEAKELEAKLDEGNIQEAESALREGLSLNFEEARALLGKLEYQRGNVEGALRVFDGIDLEAAIQRLQSSLSEKTPVKKGPTRSESPSSVSQHAATLVLEAIYLKAKSLQKLDKFTEAAKECKRVLDAVEKIFGQGIPDTQVDNKLQEIVSHAVELLPELWKQTGCYNEALSAYRNALLSQWNLDNDCCARIQMAFAVFMLYSGVEASPPSLAVQIDGSYVPKNNLEEAILLLMILLRKFSLGKINWDPSIMEHLTFALSACGQTSILAKQFEELAPGVYHRIDRWNFLALCNSGAGENESALNLLRMSLHKHERPDDLISLLLAAKICSEDPHHAAEGAGYAQRAINIAQGLDGHLKGVGLRMLGLCLGKQAKVSSSDFERSMLQSKALQSLEEAVRLERNNYDLIFELAIQYAEHRNLTAALSCAKQFFDKTGGSKLKGWRLLALVLSAQKRFSEAEVVTDAALDETAKWEQGPLLRLKAKLKISQLRPMDAIEIYRYLLALVQAQRKSSGPLKLSSQVEDYTINEFEVWHGLANLYASLSHWKDAEICLQKARELKEYSAATIHTEGSIMFDGRGEYQEALIGTFNAVLFEPNYVPSKILMASLILKMGFKASPVARSLLSDALRIEPTNRMAWYYLGLTHKADGRLVDAADCFQAASMLEESDPIENFSCML
ncbi:Tetratricopeptide repeat protein 7B [Glycine soja]|uniref:Tetratricopeptide repeat protein 7B n=1 Tax=Glycine soja TaxID=3848 RepID=A0A0B2SSY9_GLYSO|nr:Tetratricopeptide repeat protein 7B [Glycine soja]